MPARFAHCLAFVLNDGSMVYPVRRANLDTLERTFRLGLAPDARGEMLEVEREEDMVKLVLGRQWSVRCSTKDGRRKGLYSILTQSVRTIVHHDESEVIG